MSYPEYWEHFILATDYSKINDLSFPFWYWMYFVHHALSIQEKKAANESTLHVHRYHSWRKGFASRKRAELAYLQDREEWQIAFCKAITQLTLASLWCATAISIQEPRHNQSDSQRTVKDLQMLKLTKYTVKRFIETKSNSFQLQIPTTYFFTLDCLKKVFCEHNISFKVLRP